MRYLALIICFLVAWYTFNIARVAWRGGNRSGAAWVAFLALVSLFFPASLLLLR